MKKTLTLALALALICTLVCVFALTSSADEFSFTFAEGVLTVVGSGEMPDYSNDSPAPWAGHKDDTTKVIIPAGITKIGGGAFAHFTSKFDVEVGADVTVIGGDAFAYCTGGIGTMKLPAGLTELKQGVTFGTTVDKVIFAGTVKDFAAVKQGAYETGTDGAAWQFATALTASEITPFNDGFENWGGSDNKIEGENAVTQLLVCLDGKLEEFFYKYKNKFTFKASFNGTEVALVPGSNYADMILRFEPCIAATPYVPTKGAKYTIGLKAYIGDTLVYDGVSAEEKFTCPVDPIVRTPNVKVEPFNDGWENWHSETQLLLKLVSDNTYGDELETELLTNAANYKFVLTFDDGETVVTKTIAPSSKSGNLLLRFQTAIAADPFVPTKDKTYKVTLKVYNAAGNELYFYGTGENFKCGMEPVVPTKLTIEPYADGWENWRSETQLLLKLVAADTFADEIETEFLTNVANYTFKLTFNDGETVVTKTIAPSSKSGNLLLRFQTAIAADPFVPTKDKTYKVTLDVFDATQESALHLYTGTGEGFKCGMDPVVPVALTVAPYSDGWENWGDPQNTQLLLKLNAADTFADKIEEEFLNNKANYTFKITFKDGETSETHTLVPTSKSGDLLLRFMPCIDEDAFVPTKGKTYTVTIDVYDATQDTALHLYTGEGQGFVCNIDPILPENPPTADAAVIATIVVAVALVGMAVAAKKVRV